VTDSLGRVNSLFGRTIPGALALRPANKDVSPSCLGLESEAGGDALSRPRDRLPGLFFYMGRNSPAAAPHG